MTASRNPRVSPYLVLIVGIFAVSSGSILARLAQDEGVPSLVIAAGRTLVAALILLPFMLTRRMDEIRAMRAADWRLAFLSGIALAIHFATWITSLSYTSVAASTVLVSTSPLWVALAAPFFLREPFTRWLKIGMTLALVGTMIISLESIVGVENGRFLLNTTDLATGQQPLLGSALALIGGLAAAIYLLIGRKLRPRLSLTSYAALVYGTASMCLVLVIWLTGNSMLGYSPQVYLLFLALGVVPQLMGHSSFNYALGYLPAASVGITIFAEPITASIMALILFGEQPAMMVVLGSVIVLVGVLVSIVYQ
ncbi:MAG: EamA family transporter [Chloroflexi bacterium]|nr:MAG: EamA family transporter [Chloroflexota bacterium]